MAFKPVREYEDQGDIFDGSAGSLSDIADDEEAENTVRLQSKTVESDGGQLVDQLATNVSVDETDEDEQSKEDEQERIDKLMEDVRHPCYVPRGNRYFLHDDREYGDVAASDDEIVIREEDNASESNDKSKLYSDKLPLYSTFEEPKVRHHLWSEDEDNREWGHDMYQKLVDEMNNVNISTEQLPNGAFAPKGRYGRMRRPFYMRKLKFENGSNYNYSKGRNYEIANKMPTESINGRNWKKNDKGKGEVSNHENAFIPKEQRDTNGFKWQTRGRRRGRNNYYTVGRTDRRYYQDVFSNLEGEGVSTSKKVTNGYKVNAVDESASNIYGPRRRRGFA